MRNNVKNTRTKTSKQLQNTKISFRDAIYNFWTRGMDFRGVASRREYWYCWIFMLLVNIVFSFAGAVVSTVVGAIMLIPRWAVSVRRFHSVGLSGWLYMVPALTILIWFIIREGTWVRLALLGYLTPDCIVFIGLVLLVCIFNLVVFCMRNRVVAQKNTSGRK